MLVSLLATNAVVLTLHVKTIVMPLVFPALQHLVLALDPNAYFKGPQALEQTHRDLFPAISALKGLRTLYLESSGYRTTIIGTMDLTKCVHLQHVALRGVILQGLLALPAACLLHATCLLCVNEELSRCVGHQVTGLALEP